MSIKSYLLLASFFIALNIVSQDVPKKWSLDIPLSSSFIDPNNTYKPGELPQVSNKEYVPPVTSSRFVITPYEMILVAPSQRVLPRSNVHQTEVIMLSNPNVSNLLFGSSNAIAFSGASFTFISEGVYVSNNNGISWFGSDTLQGAPIGNHGGDPAPSVDKNGALIMTHLGFSTAGMFGNGSTNNGATWSANFTIQAGSVDKNLGCSDDDPTSPFYGRSYVAYVAFVSPYPCRISFTTTGGTTWSAPVTPITPAAGYIVRGTDMCVGPGGVVYSVWANGLGNGIEDFLSFVKSTDGGVTWTGSNNVVDMNGLLVFGTGFAPYGIRMNSFPRIAVDKTGGARNGWIYVCASQKNLAPAGSDADIVLYRSSNGGTSWMPTVRVNQDPLNNGKLQFYNAVCVDNQGGVNCLYYSNTNTASDSAEVILARSLDGGATFSEVVLSDHRFRPKQVSLSGIAAGYAGDYIGITHHGGKVHGIWMDDVTGNYQAWTANITAGPPPVNDVSVGPFLSFPGSFTANTPYTIKARVTNGGTAAQTSLPVRFSVNGVIQTTNTIPSLPAGVSDSSAFSWTPAVQGSYTLRIFSGAAVDENRFNDTVTTVVSVLPQGTINQQTTICRNGLNKAITDNQTTYDTINVNIPNSFNVVDVNVKIDTVIHTFDGDLLFTLSHLAGSSGIINRVGSGGDNFIGTMLNDSASTPIASGTAPFSAGPYIPSSPLSTFNGLVTNGPWILSIADMAGGDVGSLRAWCLIITYQTILGGIQTIEIPNYYSLSQNYPNPFNPSTSIKFTLPKAEIVSLKVYDVLGKEVAVLVNELKQPGVYDVDFNGSNLASGIYFYRIEAGEFTSVKKLMLVK